MACRYQSIIECIQSSRLVANGSCCRCWPTFQTGLSCRWILSIKQCRRAPRRSCFGMHRWEFRSGQILTGPPLATLCSQVSISVAGWKVTNSRETRQMVPVGFDPWFSALPYHPRLMLQSTLAKDVGRAWALKPQRSCRKLIGVASEPLLIGTRSTCTSGRATSHLCSLPRTVSNTLSLCLHPFEHSL